MQTHNHTDTHIEPTAGFDNWCQNTGLSMFSFKFYGAPYAPRRKSGRQSVLGTFKTNMECQDVPAKEIQGLKLQVYICSNNF